jgi:cyclopropane fatty-acyl-phospholipid synthase-like methyltransferase
MEKPEWFKDWFNSSYYHILYKNRDEKEAAIFIDKLADHLKLNESHVIWDLACGKGRHSLYLNKKGYNVTGTDLSQNNIQEASRFASDTLEFEVHDMREPFRTNYFTHVFNLFTSIGYFENFQDNLNVFSNVYAALKKNGLFVIDFFNADVVLKNLVHSDTKMVEDIAFRIKKEIVGKHIIKTISFSDQGQDHCYKEKVSLLTYDDFILFSKQAGFKVKEVFGNYDLAPFNKDHSERLILIFEK